MPVVKVGFISLWQWGRTVEHIRKRIEACLGWFWGRIQGSGALLCIECCQEGGLILGSGLSNSCVEGGEEWNGANALRVKKQQGVTFVGQDMAMFGHFFCFGQRSCFCLCSDVIMEWSCLCLDLPAAEWPCQMVTCYLNLSCSVETSRPRDGCQPRSWLSGDATSVLFPSHKDSPRSWTSSPAIESYLSKNVLAEYMSACLLSYAHSDQTVCPFLWDGRELAVPLRRLSPDLAAWDGTRTGSF